MTQDTILATRVEPRGSNQKTPNFDRLRTQYDDLLVRVRALPGVRAASLSSMTPLGVNETLLEGDVIGGSAPVESGAGSRNRSDGRSTKLAATGATAEQ